MQQALAEKLEAEETARLGQEEQYSSLQEEIDSKTRKLKKLYAKFKAAQAEIKDLQDEFQREKEDILDTSARRPERRIWARTHAPSRTHRRAGTSHRRTRTRTPPQAPPPLICTRPRALAQSAACPNNRRFGSSS